MSLLGHLVAEWCREDAASRALAYVLDPDASPGMAKALVDSLGRTGLPSFLPGRVEHDPTQADASRPGLTIRDADGELRIIVQATFWEGVDDAQPAAYLRELPTDTPSALVFVAPAGRVPSLWRELKARCRHGTDIALRDASWDGGDIAWARVGARILLLTSWSQVLQALQRAAEDPAIEQDIIQLRGLTDRMEREAFLPLDANEVANDALARRVTEYCRLVDRITDRLVSDGIASLTKPWNAGSHRSGRMVNRSMRVHDQFELRLGIELPAWRDLGITPLWCVLTGPDDGDWERIKSLDNVHPYEGWLYIPIRLKTGAEEDAVIRDAVEQVRDAADRLIEVTRHE